MREFVRSWLDELEHVHPKWFFIGAAALALSVIWYVDDPNGYAVAGAIGGAMWMAMAWAGLRSKGRSQDQ